MKLWDRVKMFGYYVMFFPAIIAHEASHALAALATGSKITSFSLFPMKENKSITFASVSVVPRNRLAQIVIALAPLSLWALGSHIMFMYGFLKYANGIIAFDYREMLKVENLHASYAVWQLYAGGFPSVQDARIAVRAAVFLFLAFSLFVAVAVGIKG